MLRPSNTNTDSLVLFILGSSIMLGSYTLTPSMETAFVPGIGGFLIGVFYYCRYKTPRYFPSRLAFFLGPVVITALAIAHLLSLVYVPQTTPVLVFGVFALGFAVEVVGTELYGLSNRLPSANRSALQEFGSKYPWSRLCSLFAFLACGYFLVNKASQLAQVSYTPVPLLVTLVGYVIAAWSAFQLVFRPVLRQA